MSRILESVLGWLLDAIAFFDNIKAKRGDDELTARHKQLQRSCVWGTVLPLFVVAGGFLLGNLLEGCEAVLQRAPSVNDLRATVGMVVVGAFAAEVAYALFCYWRLWRFYNDDGGAV